MAADPEEAPLAAVSAENVDAGTAQNDDPLSVPSDGELSSPPDADADTDGDPDADADGDPDPDAKAQTTTAQSAPAADQPTAASHTANGHDGVQGSSEDTGYVIGNGGGDDSGSALSSPPSAVVVDDEPLASAASSPAGGLSASNGPLDAEPPVEATTRAPPLASDRSPPAPGSSDLSSFAFAPVSASKPSDTTSVAAAEAVPQVVPTPSVHAVATSTPPPAPKAAVTGDTDMSDMFYTDVLPSMPTQPPAGSKSRRRRGGAAASTGEPAAQRAKLQNNVRPPSDQESHPPPDAGNDDSGIDIDKMLDAISAEAAGPPSAPAAMAAAAAPVVAPSHPLPKPPTGPARMTGRNAAGRHGASAATADKPANGSYVAAGAPGTVGAVTTLGSPPATTAAGPGNAKGQGTPRALQGPAARQPNAQREKGNVERAYQSFLAEERILMSDLDGWDKFPDGSRIFIGNLSQERVSKRDVFDKFHRYGHLAQVVIKSAYGFVQFHTASEAQEAIKQLQGSEIRGRKIHLEISRPAKKESRDRDRDRSPDRARGRGGRGADRYDGREQGSGRRGRDDYRPGDRDRPDASPRRERGGRNRGGRDSARASSRDRSRSPDRGGRGYRSRRSPSPYGRSREDRNAVFDGRHSRPASDVPEVQFLVTQGLERDYIKWVQAPFAERGLKTDVLLLTPHTPPRAVVIQTHVLEGVLAVVDLDLKTQASGKIPLQVFDRSAGATNVRFDGYQDLAPQVAADVVVRAKAAAVAQQAQHQQPQYPGYQATTAAPNYAQAYGSSASTYPGAGAAPQAAPLAAAAPSLGGYDLTALASQLDSNALAQLLGALQNTQSTGAAPSAPAAYPSQNQNIQYNSAAAAAQPANLAAILGSLGAAQAAAPATGMSSGYGGGASGPYAASTGPTMPQGSTDQSFQAIMAQLAKFR